MIRPVLRAPLSRPPRRGRPTHYRKRRGRRALLVSEILAGGLLVSAHFAWGPTPARTGTNPASLVATGSRPATGTGPAVAPGTGTTAVTAPSAGSSRRPNAGPGLPSGTGPSTPAATSPSSTRTAGASGAPVSCATDLALDRAPGTGFNFLCTQGGVPVTWPTDRIVIYESGLTQVQQAAFAIAVVQWQSAARFQVSYTSSPQVADVIVTGSALGQSQPGYVEDGYTTVSYHCTPGCSYRSARVELSTTADLLQTDWVSTILHELGHVAGLNHVSRVGEVMYPYLTLGSPVTYAPGDLQGLAILAADRGA